MKAVLFTSHKDLIQDLFNKDHEPDQATPDAAPPHNLSILTQIQWTLIKLLRHRHKSRKNNAQTSHLSPLDDYAIRSGDTVTSTAYRRACFRLLLSDRVTFGVPEVLDAIVWAVRLWLQVLQALTLVRLVADIGYANSAAVGNVVVAAVSLFGIQVWRGLELLF